jgi:P4 family phage/plasmid primase-like protien
MSLISGTTNNLKHEIYNFLDDRLVESGKVHTHTSMYNPKGSYFIKNTDLDTFYELYEDAIFNKKIELHITEKHEEIAPIIIDLDFKYELETHERKHTIEHIKKIIELYITEITTLFNVDKNEEKIVSFVFERLNSYKNKGVTKDGVHILFPFIVSSPAAQYYIRDNILKKIIDIVADLGLKNVISDVVDRSVISPNTLWLLFLSNKDKPKGDPYNLKYIFDGNLNEIDFEEYFGKQSVNPVRFFSIRGRKECDLTPVREEKLHILDSSVKKKITKMKTSSLVNYDIEKIRELVSLFSPERSDNYGQWIEVGWALHNIDPNSNELLDIWIEFSKKSSKFVEGACEKEWNKSKNEGLTIACLHYWAKIDNYHKYIEFKKKDIGKHIENSIKTQSNYDIAYVLFKMYEYDFVYSDEWYYYKNHKWNRDSDGMSLRSIISTKLCEEYLKIISKYNILACSTDVTDEEKEEYKKKSKEILGIVVKLRTTAFKENIMKECKELFNNKDFIKKLDNNPYLVGFTNGVYDLIKGELRDGRPEDYMQMSTEIEKVDFDQTNEHWSDLEYFLKTIFIEEDVREYFLTYLASCLQGHNAEEKFRVWNGRGSNGKSKLIEIFVLCLGNYSIKFPVTMLTGKRAASNACSPEMVRAKGCRFGYLEEPGENERIDVGFLKELTGGDKITARGLHKEPIDFKPQFKLALLCNEIPKVPPNDHGTWRRMEVIEFKSHFCENPKEPHEFCIDKSLSEKMKNWKELFMALLVDVYYAAYKVNGIKVPQEVVNFTEEYQKNCDLYTEFIMENIEETRDNGDSIDISQFYDEFKIWYEDNFCNHKHPSKAEFKKYLKKRYGSKRVSPNDIKGFKFKIKYDKQNPNPNQQQGIVQNISIGNIQQSIVQQPVIQQPIVQQPIVQQPVIQQPIIQQPVIQQHIVQEQDVDEITENNDSSEIVDPSILGY